MSSDAKTDMVVVRVFDEQGKLTGPVRQPRVELTEAQWRERLDAEQFDVLRRKGTERPFTCSLLKNKADGAYVCAGCDLPLFTSGNKFNSGTGWPSYNTPIADENITSIEDRSHGMLRTEVVCTRCGGHLGHVFPDGPPPTGLRYCINGVSLKFVAK